MTKNAEPIIEFINVSKSFSLSHAFKGGIRSFIFHLPSAIKSLRASQFTALNNISFSVQRGESIGLIGRNGSGKSTTLGLIAKVMPPSSGQVIVRDRVSPMLQLGGGFHPDLHAIDNIMLNGVLIGLSRREVRYKIDAILDFAELGEFVDQPIRTYSSGMLARLGFSVLTQLDPKILLIDEVLAVGDDYFRAKCQSVMQGFKKKNVTILFVSHSAEDVSQLCDRAIWIHEHQIKIDGPTAESIAAYQAL